MALLLELLLTAALTLLAAFLLATFFAANEPRRDPDRSAAAAIAEEAVEEERIIEVDDVKLGERRAVVSAPEAEGWVEVEKAPAVVVAKEEPECSPEPDEEAEEVPVKSAPAVCAGAGLEEEDVDVAEKRTDLTAVAATTGVVVEASPQVLPAEAAPREEALDVVGREVDAETKHLHPDTGAEAAPSEVVGAHPEKQAAEVPPTKLEDVKAEVSPSAEAVDAGKEERARAIEVTPDELAVETSSGEIPDPDVVLEKKEEQIIEAKVNESTADAVPQAAHHVPLAEEELEVQQPSGLKVQQAVDKEAVHTCEEVPSREEAECETHPFHQKEESVPEEESVVATKHGAVEVSQEGISRDEVASELPVEVVTLQGPPEDDAESDIDLGEWEGIERSEVEKRFGAAAAFAASEAGVAALSKLDSDVQLQLQGLLKVAVDGPCYGSTQPLTLRPSSRAKWIAWQKLGNMHPEIAMEKYMNLLSEAIPGCLGNETADTKKHETGDDSAGAVLTMAATSDQRSHQGKEDTGIIDEGHLTASPNPEKGQGSSIPAE